MNQIAILSGKTVHLLELLHGLDAHNYVVCESEDRQRYVCPLEQWEAAAPPPAARVHSKSPAEEKIKLFMELFRGRGDVYAHRWYNRKTQKSGYSPACRNEWAWGGCDKKKVRCTDCPNREFIPLS